MRTDLEFRSRDLLEANFSDDTPRGETLARLLVERLPEHGFHAVDVFAEDWGWHVTIANNAFPLWLGCGHYQEWEDGLLCFIEPRKPYIRRWFKRLSTVETIERLATAVEKVIEETGKARELRWWTAEEKTRG